MRVCQVELRNFRGVQHGKVTLPDHAVLLGRNNVGKSTFVEALALLFGRERLLHPLTDWDFHGGTPSAETRFHIVATITDFTNTPSQDPMLVPDWFVGPSAATPVWWFEEAQCVVCDADPPDGAKLAAQIALAGRYDDDTCDFETIRYFYDGECDPFTDDYVRVPPAIVRQVGVFFLPSKRDWDQLLSFGSSTFLKALREYDALPGAKITQLKNDLRVNTTRIEDEEALHQILADAEQQLRSFQLIGEGASLAYRPTSLDTVAVLRSLVPHIISSGEQFLPLSRHGSGTIALQAFLLVLAFGRYRKRKNENFVLIAEEPELHLHPPLQRLLVNRVRGVSSQSLITTHSTIIAASYHPSQVILLQNDDGEVTAEKVRTEPLGAIKPNSIKKLYTTFREQFYEALMGGVVVVPEGKLDFEWLGLAQMIAQSAISTIVEGELVPITVVPTSDAAVVQTYLEISRFRPDVLPLVDGDRDGSSYCSELLRTDPQPKVIARYGNRAATECLAAWILEPCLISQWDLLKAFLRLNDESITLKKLQQRLCHSEFKDNSQLHEEFAWLAMENKESVRRAREFISDLVSIATGKGPRNSRWTVCSDNGTSIHVAEHIQKL